METRTEARKSAAKSSKTKSKHKHAVAAKRATKVPPSHELVPSEKHPPPAVELRVIRHDARVPLDRAIAAARAVGLLSSFDEHGAVGATLSEVLAHHYEANREQRRRDRFYACEFPWLDCTHDLIAELNAVVPGAPIWQQIEADWREIRVESPAGHPQSIHYDLLFDVARAYDAQLEYTKSPWRLVFVEYPGSSSAGFFAVDQAGAARLVEAGLVAG
ncbi:MAG: hypothetical protein U0228_15275 [Myxococcaceae bacterium]